MKFSQKKKKLKKLNKLLIERKLKKQEVLKGGPNQHGGGGVPKPATTLR